MINVQFQRFSKVLAISAMGFCTASLALPNMNRQQCQQQNWQQLGYQDGMNGQYLQQAIQDYRKVCGKFHVRMNADAYRRGWHTGAQLYCKKDHGYELGKQGKLYNNICPHSQIEAFNRAWNRGVGVFCTPQSGFKLGLSGRTFPGFCPPWSDRKFNVAYNEGKRYYQQIARLQKKRTALDKKIAIVQKDLQLDQSRLDRAQNLLLQKKVRGALAKKIRLEVNHLNEKMDGHYSTLTVLGQQSNRLKQQISYLNQLRYHDH